MWSWNILLVFVECGLQQTERVDQTSSEAQLLSDSPLQACPLHTVLVQIELLLRLFADQLGLKTHKRVQINTETLTVRRQPVSTFRFLGIFSVWVSGICYTQHTDTVFEKKAFKSINTWLQTLNCHLS